MTERDYQGVLDIVETAINVRDAAMICIDSGAAPQAANDNDAAWPLEPFPEGWHASP